MMEANYQPLADMVDSDTVPKHVIHCSTAYAVPLDYVSDHEFIKEESFPVGDTFFSTYAESKYLIFTVTTAFNTT